MIGVSRCNHAKYIERSSAGVPSSLVKRVGVERAMVVVSSVVGGHGGNVRSVAVARVSVGESVGTALAAIDARRTIRGSGDAMRGE